MTETLIPPFKSCRILMIHLTLCFKRGRIGIFRQGWQTIQTFFICQSLWRTKRLKLKNKLRFLFGKYRNRRHKKRKMRYWMEGRASIISILRFRITIKVTQVSFIEILGIFFMKDHLSDWYALIILLGAALGSGFLSLPYSLLKFPIGSKC